LEQRPARPSFFSVVFANAFLVAGVYLATGLALELWRRLRPSMFVERALFRLDGLPAWVLERAGLMQVLQERYLDGTTSGFTMRLIFAGVTLAIIFLIALGVSVLLHLLLRGRFQRLPR
jgi:hypothetical protein